VLDPESQARFEKLSAARRKLAAAQGWPAYCVMHNSTMREVARTAPSTLDELAEIKGVGASKAAKYGEALLKALR
jgi:ATP-dependent DNA helicase RecQ